MSLRRVVFAALAGVLLGVVPLVAQDKIGTQKPPEEVYKVTYKDLQLKIVERGSLEAADNGYVKCEVKQGNRGSQIKWLVENGASVKKGDLLVEFDDSYLQEQVLNQKIILDKAQIDLEVAEQLSKLQPRQTELSIKVAESSLEWAQSWLKEFDDGGAEVKRKDVKSRLKVAEADVALWRERVAVAEKKLKDDKTTEGLVKAKRQKQEAAVEVVDRYKAELELLEKYTLPRERKTLEANVESAKGTLEVTRQECANKDKQVKAELPVMRAVWKQQEAQYNDLLEQVKLCKIYAARSGPVVYYVPEQIRPETTAVIAKGESVKFGQQLLSMPDLSHMLVNVRIAEGFVHYVKEGLPVIVGVDALPNKTLKAHVKTVENSGSVNKGVRLFPVYVEFDDNVQDLRLKPGLSAAVTIYTAVKAEHVLAVPVSMVILPKEKGKKPLCVVKTSGKKEYREVELGLNDGKMVEIKSGLKEGDEILYPPTLSDEK